MMFVIVCEEWAIGGDGITREPHRALPFFELMAAVAQESDSGVIDRGDRADTCGWPWARPWRSDCGKCDRRGSAWWASLHDKRITNFEPVDADRALLLRFSHLHVLDQLAVSVRQSVALTVRPGILNFQRKSLDYGSSTKTCSIIASSMVSKEGG